MNNIIFIYEYNNKYNIPIRIFQSEYSNKNN